MLIPILFHTPCHSVWDGLTPPISKHCTVNIPLFELGIRSIQNQLTRQSTANAEQLSIVRIQLYRLVVPVI
jgi:hypothetical protein